MLVNVAIPGDVCPVWRLSQVPGAITTSAFGSFYQKPVEHTYNDCLPSANLRCDVARDLVARFAIARTMARPDLQRARRLDHAPTTRRTPATAATRT